MKEKEKREDNEAGQEIREIPENRDKPLKESDEGLSCN
jgi:hypothetical protein